jgi:uncharacterized membrane protein
MEIGFKNKEILEEISNNIDTTLDLTKQNTDAFVSSGAVLFAMGSLWEPITNGYNTYPIVTSIVLVGSIVSIILVVYKRMVIIKKIKNIIHWFNSKFN